MYEIGVRDRVESADDLPKPEPGAPMPMVFAADNGTVILMFHAARPGNESGAGDRAQITVVRFDGCIAHLLGGPNDEALAAHPLYVRGLRHYGVFRVLESSWVTRLEHMNSVHPRHRAEVYRSLMHFVYTFHDSVFECVARSVQAALTSKSRGEVIEEIAHEMGGSAA